MLPPWVEYEPGQRAPRLVPWDTYFNLQVQLTQFCWSFSTPVPLLLPPFNLLLCQVIQEYSPAITMEHFMDGPGLQVWQILKLISLPCKTITLYCLLIPPFSLTLSALLASILTYFNFPLLTLFASFRPLWPPDYPHVTPYCTYLAFQPSWPLYPSPCLLIFPTNPS